MENNIKNLLIYTDAYLEGKVKVLNEEENELTLQQTNQENTVNIITKIKKLTKERIKDDKVDVYGHIIQVFNHKTIEWEPGLKEETFASYGFSLINTIDPETKDKPIKVLAIGRVERNKNGNTFDILELKNVDKNETIDKIVETRVKTYKK